MKADQTVKQFKIKNPPFRLSEKDKKLTEPSWAESAKLVRELLTWVGVWIGLAKDLAAATTKILELSSRAFRSTPVVDCALNDSPLSLSRIIYAMRAHLKKIGWAGINQGQVMAPSVEIKEFDVVMKEATDWLLKFNDENNNQTN